jgi:pimeloyl-ACP methyl ester carboxylesterase
MPLLDGITSAYVETPRLRQHILTCGPEQGETVILVHGNFSSATFWEELMLALSSSGLRCVAPDLRGYGWTEDKPVDARRGLVDFTDDLDALVTTLGLPPFHLVGWSLGGGVVCRYLINHPDQVLTVTLQAPVSPYGFGGTKGVDGIPCYDDYAGSGGGTVNPEFVKRIAQGDRSSEDPNSPRNVINAFYYAGGFRASREEDFLAAALRERIGEDRYPGDFVPSANWPNVAPGVWGPINAGSPKYVAGDADALVAVEPKPPILWIRGADDQIVSDLSMFDFGALGQLELVPGWPGEDVYPPQPMVGQTRNVLERYAAVGGAYREVVLQNCAHSPHVEHPQRWVGEFLGHIGRPIS